MDHLEIEIEVATLPQLFSSRQVPIKQRCRIPGVLQWSYRLEDARMVSRTNAAANSLGLHSGAKSSFYVYLQRLIVQ